MKDTAIQIRSNYFMPSDPGRLEALLGTVKTAGKPFRYGQDGSGRFMFRCDGQVLGTFTNRAKRYLARDPGWVAKNPDEAYSMDAFYTELQSLITPGDACIVQSFYLDDARCLKSEADVITRDRIGYLDLCDAAVKKARAMLGDGIWQTEFAPPGPEDTGRSDDDGPEQGPACPGEA